MKEFKVGSWVLVKDGLSYDDALVVGIESESNLVKVMIDGKPLTIDRADVAGVWGN